MFFNKYYWKIEFDPWKIEPVEMMPNHVSAFSPVPKETTGIAIQSTVLLKAKTSLILFTCKENDSWDHIQIQKAQNTLVRYIACVFALDYLNIHFLFITIQSLSNAFIPHSGICLLVGTFITCFLTTSSPNNELDPLKGQTGWEDA